MISKKLIDNNVKINSMCKIYFRRLFHKKPKNSKTDAIKRRSPLPSTSSESNDDRLDSDSEEQNKNVSNNEFDPRKLKSVQPKIDTNRYSIYIRTVQGNHRSRVGATSWARCHHATIFYFSKSS